MIRYILLTLFLSSCASQMTSSAMNHSALEEVRVALLDVRQTLSQQQMEMQLLEDKLAKLKPSAQVKTTSLEARIRQIEKSLDKIQADLHHFSNHANQTTQSLLQYKTQIASLDKEFQQQNDRLNEISKLKTTLHSISHALENPQKDHKIHRVSPGESLAKIASHYGITVEALKKGNNLSSDTIFINQELKIP